MQWMDYNDVCCPKNGTCTNENCQESPSCRRCKRTAQSIGLLDENFRPTMALFNYVPASGDNNRPFGA